MIRFNKNLHPSRHRLFCLAIAFVLILLGNTASAWQVYSSETVAPPVEPKIERVNEKDTKASQKKMSDARVAKLLGFAKEHHPEILPLLDFLKTKRPKKFDKVIKRLNRDVSKLERTKQKSPEAYQVGLAAWVNQSQTQLYAAQYKVAADKETAAKLREKIKMLVTEKVDARIEFLEQERAKAQAKGDRLEKAIEHQKATRETTIRKRVNNVTKRALDISEKNKSPKAKEKPAKQDTPEQANPEQKPPN